MKTMQPKIWKCSKCGQEGDLYHTAPGLFTTTDSTALSVWCYKEDRMTPHLVFCWLCFANLRLAVPEASLVRIVEKWCEKKESFRMAASGKDFNFDPTSIEIEVLPEEDESEDENATV